jgi:hypothetical protein
LPRDGETVTANLDGIAVSQVPVICLDAVYRNETQDNE